MTARKLEAELFVIVWDSNSGEAAVDDKVGCIDRLRDLVEYEGPESIEGALVYELGKLRSINIETSISF